MNLKHISHTSCPDCHAKMISWRCEHQHTNGDWNEYRTFECGSIHHYIPNFRQVKIEQRCPNTKQHKERVQKRENVLCTLRALVDSADCDDDYKRLLQAALMSYNLFND